MTRPALAALWTCLLALAGTDALAQSLPFDMSPELYLRDSPAAGTPDPQAEPEPGDTPAAIPDGELGTAPEGDATHLDRFLLPGTGIRFEGEMGRRGFTIHLTERQAAAPATLNLALLNAIVVSPEDSHLEIAINGTRLAAPPIAYAAPSSLVVEIAEGTLVPGANRIDIGAVQRHRTDCSVASTYELWTDIYAEDSFLRLEGEALARVTSLEDLPAIGLGASGATTLRFLAPDIESEAAITAALHLVQALALAIGSPQVEVELMQAWDAEAPPSGALTVIVATADRLPAIAQSARERAEAGPVATFLAAEQAPNTLAISGPDWSAVTIALGALETGGTQSPDDFRDLRIDLPDAVPLIGGRAEIPLSTMGVETVEFNGRRFHTDFKFALPADFYADMYSEAELVLDAAYSPAVMPGSQLDIYVNGQIASVIPILRTEGGTFRNSRLRIPMTNFRPGINAMNIETVLLTREDEVCPPGLSGRAAGRFLFSSASRLAFPDYGRIAQYPDLRALAGAGSPYAQGEAVQVAVPAEPEAIEAAMLLLARLALEAGTPLAVRATAPNALDPAADALIVAPMAALSASILGRSGVVTLDEASRLPILGNDDDALDRWRESSGASGSAIAERARFWIADRLGLTPENFWLFRRTDGAYLPQSDDAVVLSQTRQDEGGVWTLLTIPQASDFVPATRRLVEPAMWQQVAGRVSAVAPDEEDVLVLQPSYRALVPTQPLSPGNLRLISANWLSTNVLGYAVILFAISLLLTVATRLLLAGVRRGKR